MFPSLSWNSEHGPYVSSPRQRLNSQFGTAVVLTSTWVELFSDPRLFAPQLVKSRDHRTLAIFATFLGGMCSTAVVYATNSSAVALGITTGASCLGPPSRQKIRRCLRAFLRLSTVADFLLVYLSQVFAWSAYSRGCLYPWRGTTLSDTLLRRSPLVSYYEFMSHTLHFHVSHR